MKEGSGYLRALGERIRDRAGTGGTVIINHPAEARLLGSLSGDELRSFAADRGLRVISRMEGTAFEFSRDGRD